MNPTDQQKFFALCARGQPHELLPYLENDWQHATNANGLSGFYIACSEGNFPNMQLLYEHGADIHAVNASGLNALDAAAHAGKLENIQWLVEKKNLWHSFQRSLPHFW